ncbi:hypothetical protein [Azospira inquinata]|uniref:Uncharacterized protein n=1 Tax=Azospira inquinata TaxID=2785627 RepID=A0A975SMV2_9RHOO|nr:hypothetical protein [Azospira inquinata]QWT45399.1 hypothetical protein J8L76_10645 [Azospira inquinata]QWT49273.1 hypothetical protein Azoinq_01235 [Azospira inquinata]
MTTSTPTESLRAGVAVLLPVLAPHGFKFKEGATGASSGGTFASGRFELEDRLLEFHFRHALGLVSYRIGTAEIDHENYLRFAGHWSSHKYPNFGGTPEESFSALASDLLAFFADFLSVTGEQFNAVAAAHAANPTRFKGFASLCKK